jgi:hypothetical protein
MTTMTTVSIGAMDREMRGTADVRLPVRVPFDVARKMEVGETARALWGARMARGRKMATA